MDPQQPSSDELLAEALELDPTERDAFLRARLAEQPGRLSELRGALSLHARIDGVLGEAGDSAAVGWVGQSDRLVPGRRIGTYEILGLINIGGMGSVYEALQDSPRRTVALKVLRGRLDSDSARKRFEYEARILAHLGHPGIARIYEAGLHEQAGERALPFIALEFIARGRSILRFARDEQLGRRERVELFLQVLDAIHHAHARGIVHRDLKPDNVLVDADGQVKVIDFGIARVDEGASLLSTALTQDGQILGTLPYMSPEQVEDGPGGLDARSDVYSLGVMLYELLVGAFPYEVERRPLPAIARSIQLDMPRRPSSSVEGFERDLETILLVALEKSPGRRYQSARAFADDLERFLASEPIHARPSSASYQLRLFARRHPALISATVAIVVVLSASLAVTTRMWWSAERAQAEAESEAEHSRKVAGMLAEILAAPQPYGHGTDVRVVDLLADAEERIENEFDDRPRSRAPLLRALAGSYLALGHHRHGLELLDEALALRAGDLEFEASDESFEDLHARATALIDLARYRAAIEQCDAIIARATPDRPDEALAARRTRALALSRGGEPERAVREARDLVIALQDRPEPDDWLLLSTRSVLGLALLEEGNLYAARTELQAVVDTRRAEQSTDPNSYDLIVALRHLGRCQRELGEYDASAAAMAEIEALQSRIQPRPQPRSLSYELQGLQLLTSQQRFDEALQRSDELLARAREAVSTDDPLYLDAFEQRVSILLGLGQYNDAVSDARQALEMREALHGPGHSMTRRAAQTLGATLHRLSRHEEAEELYLRALAAPPLPLLGHQHRRIVLGLVDLYRETGRIEEAFELLAALEEAWLREADEEDMVLLELRRARADLYMAQSRFDRAQRIYEDCAETYAERYGEDKLITLGARNSLGRMLVENGQFERGRDLLEPTLEGLRRAGGETHLQTITAAANLGVAYLYLGRPERAIEILERHRGPAIDALGADQPMVMRIVGNLAAAYRMAKRYDPALDLYLQHLETTSERYGEDSLETLEARYNVALLLREMGQVEDYFLELEELLRIHRDTETEHSYQGLIVLRQLALQYRDRERLDESIELLDEACEHAPSALPAGHWFTALARGSLANTLVMKKVRLDEAVELLERAHADLAASYGEEHAYTRNAKSGIARAKRAREAAAAEAGARVGDGQAVEASAPRADRP